MHNEGELFAEKTVRKIRPSALVTPASKAPTRTLNAYDFENFLAPNIVLTRFFHSVIGLEANEVDRNWRLFRTRDSASHVRA